MRRHGIGICIAVAIGAAMLAAPASAAVDCAYDDAADTLTVSSDSAASDPADFALVGREPGGAIVVATLAGAVACTGAGGPATVNNIGTLNMTGSAGDTLFALIEPAGLAPGNGGTGEIEVIVLAGGGTDQFEVLGTTGNDFFVLGAAGMNWTGDQDVDGTFVGVEFIGMSGNTGQDALTGRGADGTGAPYAGPAQFTGSGNDDNDVVEGGDGVDLLDGGDDEDTLRGFAGADTLSGGSGTNQLDGGAGEDVADYLIAANGVNVDLAAANPQSTGLGIDTLTSIEGLSGSNQADTLSGDAGPNDIYGADADDVLNGRGGNDDLNGGAGVNTVTYADAPAGVNVDLDASPSTASGGAGTDSLLGIQNVIGSPFADSLIGDVQNNSIIALGGTDTVSALGGADVVDVRDGGPDTASCGDGTDSATADRASVDTVNPDCETIDFLPEPPGGGGEPPPAEDRHLDFDLSAKAKQRVVKREAVVVRARCPLEDCDATAGGGKLKPRDAELAAAEAEKLTLKLRRKKLRAIEAALEAGRKPKVKVRAEATDAAGNVATDTITVRAKA